MNLFKFNKFIPIQKQIVIELIKLDKVKKYENNKFNLKSLLHVYS